MATASEKLGEEVRKQGQGTAMTELTFNPLTGEFEQRPKGSSTGTGEVVTTMTEKGFAN
jgi:hypothetical protein